MKKIFCVLIVFSLLLSIWGCAPATAADKPSRLIGLYISWWTMQYPARLDQLIKDAKQYQFNSFVCDFRKETPMVVSNLKKIKAAGYYAIARIVVFEEGVGASYAIAQNEAHLKDVFALAKRAQELGFDEIQYDYIRFSDKGSADPKKTEIITNILKEARQEVQIPVQIDIFGSVAYQPHRIIGQDLRLMKEHVDAVCPMLYPSHFDNDRMRMGDPYTTMLEGSLQTKAKVADRKVRVIPYIQGFSMRMSWSGLSLKDYIKEQIRAVEDAGTDGFFVWHAANDYSATFAAIAEYGQLYNRPALSEESIFQKLSPYGYTPTNSRVVNGGIQVIAPSKNSTVKPI
jgi:hypothetical protein